MPSELEGSGFTHPVFDGALPLFEFVVRFSFKIPWSARKVTHVCGVVEGGRTHAPIPARPSHASSE